MSRCITEERKTGRSLKVCCSDAEEAGATNRHFLFRAFLRSCLPPSIDLLTCQDAVTKHEQCNITVKVGVGV